MWHTIHEIFQKALLTLLFTPSITSFSKVKVNYNIRLFAKTWQNILLLSSKWLNFKMPFSLIKICVYALLANHRKYFFFLLLHWIIPLMISGAARDQTLQKKNSHKQTFWLSSDLSKGKKNSEILESKLIGNSEQNPVLVKSSLLLTVFTVNSEFYLSV